MQFQCGACRKATEYDPILSGEAMPRGWRMHTIGPITRISVQRLWQPRPLRWRPLSLLKATSAGPRDRYWKRVSDTCSIAINCVEYSHIQAKLHTECHHHPNIVGDSPPPPQDLYTSVHSSPPSAAFSTQNITMALGWCAWKTSMSRAAWQVQRTTSCARWKHLLCTGMNG